MPTGSFFVDYVCLWSQSVIYTEKDMLLHVLLSGHFRFT